MKDAGGFSRKIIPLIPFFAILTVLFLLRKKLAGVYISVAAAAFLAYMLDPVVKFVQKHMKFVRKKTREKAVTVTFIIFVLALVGVTAFVVPIVVSNVIEIVEKADEIVPKITAYLQKIISDEHYEIKQKLIEIINSAEEKATAKINEVYNIATSFSLYEKLSEAIVGIITAIVLTYYFMRDKTHILNGVFGLFPYRWRDFVTETADELGMISAKFVQGQIFVSLIIGSLETVGLLLLGMPYSAFFGIIGGFSNLIPYFGPFIGAVLPVITALGISPVKALWVLALFLIVQQIDNHFISPKIIEGNLGIHPMVVIIVIFAGQELFGVWGLIAAVPVYATVKCILAKFIKIISINLH